jgi:branched-chain amino acid aminotransferase
VSLAQRDGVIWIDGEYVPWAEATVHVLTHTLHYGVGVFEGVRAYNTDQGAALFRLDAHTDRLYDSAHILQMQIPFSKEELNQVQQEVLRKNNLHEAYVRPMVYYNGETLSLHTSILSTHVMVAAWAWGAYLGEGALEKGIRVMTSSFTRNQVNSVLCKAKANGNYMNSILAVQEAMAHGFDEALLLDAQGYVAEGSGENLFVIKNGVVYTPELTAILPGITRHTVMMLSADLGLLVCEKRITRDEVYIADEAFFTGTAAEVTPICSLDHRQIGTGNRGPITERIQKAYIDLVRGRNKKYREWLTYI